MMKVLRVAMLTASAICPMSASLKFGVMRSAPCWAEATDMAASTAAAQARPAPLQRRASRARSLIRIINSPRTPPAASLVAGGWRRRLPHRHLLRHLHGLWARRSRRACELVRFRCQLRHIQREILLPAVPHDCDACLARGSQGAKNLLAPGRIVERRAVDTGHEVTWTQSQAHESLAVRPRVHPVATLFTVREHRLGSHHIGDQAGLIAEHAPHAVDG